MAAKRQYTASKTLNKGRKAYSVSFRHPLRKDPKGNALKIRRGLGTSDEKEANIMVAELNELLGDQGYWSVTKRQDAEKHFSKTVVDAFYGSIEEDQSDPWAVREKFVPLPGRKDGYPKILLVGPTGAGKTSLLRHLVGTSPNSERFPSTARGRTTISDIEIITADSSFEAVVTFLSEWEIRTQILECILEGATAYLNGSIDSEIAERFLFHKDQRFRMTYILGNWPESENESLSDENWDFGEAEEGGINVGKTDLPEIETDYYETKNLNNKLIELIDRIKQIASEALSKVSATLETDIRGLKSKERIAAQEWFEEAVENSDDFSDLVNDVIEEILFRFEQIEKGQLQKRKSGWPEAWYYKEKNQENRNDFLKQVRWFSSNNSNDFGRLLTPLVEGIRVKGPLFPGFTNRRPKFVIMDGQGIGHEATDASSVSTHISDKFADVDTIVMVDIAIQPMLQPSVALLRTIGAGGFHEKLAITFTHFDKMTGPSLRSVKDKMNHVKGPLFSALSSLTEVIGSEVVNEIERSIPSRIFMFGNLDRELSEIPAGPQKQLIQLIDLFQESIKPTEIAKIRPVYDPASLMYAVQAATNEFHERWNAILGFEYKEGVSKEHWARIKALNRRIALKMNIEYLWLKPIADLADRLRESISMFLDSPIRWENGSAGFIDNTQAQKAISAVRQNVSKVVNRFSLERIVSTHIKEWMKAYEYRGPGSTFDRAREIRNIYETAAPVPAVILNEISERFLSQLRKEIHEAIKEGGGILTTME
ncbi:hypothetical protein ACFL0O_05210 [Thermodesulfobacteriota bacterium]